MDVVSGQSFEAIYEAGVSGLVGTIAVRMDDNQGVIVFGPTTANIIELSSTGIYRAQLTAPVLPEQFSIIFSNDGSFDPDAGVGVEDLFVHLSAATFPPLVPGDQDGGPRPGPCFGWVEAEAVADCCDVSVGSDTSLFEAASSSASQLLYELSGRRWKGSCERVVRAGMDWPCGLQVLSSGYIIGWENIPVGADFTRVLLPNYPVTEILEVKIDGAPLTADEYRLDGWRWLTRKADAAGNRQFWPGPQRDDRDDTEEQTFSIQYVHGQNPPLPGIDAAAQLACEIYKSCPGNEGVPECKLPKNATRVTRQGITIELNALNYDRSKKVWVTGMNLVDLFLNAYNPNGLKRPPMIWSPDEPRFAHEIGTTMGS